MKILINTQDLLHGLNIVKPAIISRPLVPVCECVRFNVDKEKITLSTTNMNHSILTDVIQSESDKTGIFLLWFSEIFNFVSSLPSGEMSIEIVGNECFLTYGSINAKIDSPDHKEFPTIDFVVDAKSSFDVKHSELSMIKESVVEFSGAQDGFDNLRGVLFEFVNDELHLFASNRNIVAHYISEIKSKNGLYLVPKDFISCLKSFNRDEDITVKFSDRNIQLETEDTTYICRIMDEKPADYRSISFPSDKRFEVKRKDLLSILNAASHFSGMTNQVILTFESDSVKVSSMDIDMNKEFTSVVPIDNSKNTDGFRIGFNCNLLISALSVFNDDIVKVDMYKDNTGIYIRSVSDPDHYVCMVMPMKIYEPVSRVVQKKEEEA